MNQRDIEEENNPDRAADRYIVIKSTIANVYDVILYMFRKPVNK